MLLLFYLRSSAYIVLLFLLECASALVFSLVPFVGDPDYRRKKSALAYIPDMDGSALQPDPIFPRRFPSKAFYYLLLTTRLA